MPKKSSLLSTLEKHRISIPVNWTEAIWQRLYERHRPVERGELFFRLIPFASLIEQVYRDRGVAITRRESLDTLAKIAAKQVYEDECGDEETMLVFFKHNVLKFQYDWYKKLRIEEDDQQIPQIDLPGSEISEDHASFRLTKLSKHDPRAVLVGKYTGCCETIGGYGEVFLKVALTQSFAGYYVLLDERQPIHKRIVAHSIAWRVGDAMVYSSVETNINYRDRLPLIADMYYALARKLMLDHAIKQVCVWEWINHTPPFLSLKQSLPALNKLIDSTIQHLEIAPPHPLHYVVSCIADTERPFLSLYAKMRGLPALSTGLIEIGSNQSFTKDEMGQLAQTLQRMKGDDEVKMVFEMGFIPEDSNRLPMLGAEIRPLLVEHGFTEEVIENNIREFLDITEIEENSIQFNEGLSFETCLDILKIPVNTNHRIIVDIIRDPYSVFPEAKFYLHIYRLINQVFLDEFRPHALSSFRVSKVVSGFHYDDGVRFPFGIVDLTDDESIRCFLRQLFNFCFLVLELNGLLIFSPEGRALSAPNFDQAHFHHLYRMIAPIHPVACMSVFREAILRDKHCVVDAMLRAGFDINNDQQYTETPLIFAIRNKKEAMVDQLLRHGADVNLRARKLSDSGLGVTPLEVAARAGLDGLCSSTLFNQLKCKALTIPGASSVPDNERQPSPRTHK